MVKKMLWSVLMAVAIVCACASENPHPVVVMETNMGDIEITLDRENAPVSTANFLQYVEEGFYDSTVIHRLVPRFVIQGGGFNARMQKKETRPPIKNESGNGLSNVRGTIAMARTNDLDSATSQFYINLVDNSQLDDMQYAVFGEVTDGMDVVDRIADIETINMGGPFSTYPGEAVIVESIRLR